jgi:hypothetical protein
MATRIRTIPRVRTSMLPWMSGACCEAVRGSMSIQYSCAVRFASSVILAFVSTATGFVVWCGWGFRLLGDPVDIPLLFGSLTLCLTAAKRRSRCFVTPTAKSVAATRNSACASGFVRPKDNRMSFRAPQLPLPQARENQLGKSRQGRPRIAQRFNAGFGASERRVPSGTKEHTPLSGRMFIKMKRRCP